MRLVNLSVTNFRGIQHLNWTVRGRINCLVGCGDSTKTTILDAIELVLSPRWNVAFVDSDFFNCDYSKDIVIRAVLGDLPAALLDEDKFGLYLVAWDTELGQVVELEEDNQPKLCIELKVTSSLEPEWSVIPLNDREPRHITSKERESLGVMRLGEFIDRHVTWSRGSSLARLSDGTKPIREVIADAQRSAMQAVREMEGTTLHASAETVEEWARQLGVLPKTKFVPGLDARAFNEGSISLALHDGDVPIRMHGLGTRRLLAAAIQKSVLKKDGAVIVDEVEHGLEPHRIVHLIRTLTNGDDTNSPQVFMTTHSPISIAEIGASGLSVVKCVGGNVTVEDVPKDDDFAGLVRACPAALLGRKVIVCEGPTEGGLCWAIDRAFQVDRGSFSLRGVEVADGGGNTSGPLRATKLAQLGYEVAFFGDSDKPPKPSQPEMESIGVSVFLWEGAYSTEQRIIADLPVLALQEALELASEDKEKTSYRDQIRARLTNSNPEFDWSVQNWVDAGGALVDLRAAIGLAANTNRWYKNWGNGQLLGELAIRALCGDEAKCSTMKTLEKISQWAIPVHDV